MTECKDIIEKKLVELEDYLLNNRVFCREFEITRISSVKCLKIHYSFSYSLTEEYINKNSLIVYWSGWNKYEVHNPYTKTFITGLSKNNVLKIIEGFHVDSIINYSK